MSSQDPMLLEQAARKLGHIAALIAIAVFLAIAANTLMRRVAWHGPGR